MALKLGFLLIKCINSSTIWEKGIFALYITRNLSINQEIADTITSLLKLLMYVEVYICRHVLARQCIWISSSWLISIHFIHFIHIRNRISLRYSLFIIILAHNLIFQVRFKSQKRLSSIDCLYFWLKKQKLQSY